MDVNSPLSVSSPVSTSSPSSSDSGSEYSVPPMSPHEKCMSRRRRRTNSAALVPDDFDLDETDMEADRKRMRLNEDPEYDDELAGLRKSVQTIEEQVGVATQHMAELRSLVRALASQQSKSRRSSSSAAVRAQA